MSSAFVFAKPRDWETFEDIVADVLARKYQSHNMQRYARSGQGQSGIDIVGPVEGGLLGVQCKHHPDRDIPLAEIDEAITKAETFTPSIVELIIATSASRDNKSHQHVLEISEKRRDKGRWPVTIIFWETIVGWLDDYTDLQHKHFYKYFPPTDLDHIKIAAGPKRQTVTWPASTQAIMQAISTSLKDVDRVDLYHLALGITDFSENSWSGLVDLEIRFSALSSKQPSEGDFQERADSLAQLKTTVTDPAISKDLTIYLQARLSTAALVGWVFRRTAGYQLQLAVGDELWATSGLPFVRSGLYEALPMLLNESSRELALILSLSRSIRERVNSTVSLWADKPRAVVELGLAGPHISSGSQALSIAQDISQRIKTYVDQWQMKRIHLFGAMPAPLTALITYHLNAICPIDLYFLDSERESYVLAGTITNDL